MRHTYPSSSPSLSRPSSSIGTMTSGYTSLPLTSSANSLVSRTSLHQQSDGKEEDHFNNIDHGFTLERKGVVNQRARVARWIGLILALLMVYLVACSRSTIEDRLSNRCADCLVNVGGIDLPYRYDLKQQKPDQTPPSKLGLVSSLNRTLGFEKIYVLNMPYRRDKKAELTLLAYHYDLDLVFVDGIAGRDIRPDLDWNRAHQGKFGASEAHAGVWKKMLEDEATTALILEDDVDFSVDLKNQLLRMQEPLAMLTSKLDGKPAYRNPKDPYNYQHWDQLWLGEEIEGAWKKNETPPGIPLPYVTYKDPTRSPITVRSFNKTFTDYELEFHNEESQSSERIRLVQASRNAWALSGYAMSREGAQKALYMNTHKHWVEHIDFDLMMLCRQGIQRSFSVVPPLFQQRKPMGGEDSERAGEFTSHNVIAGKIGRTAALHNTAREHLFDDILAHDKPLFVQRL